jgi:multidrug resistance efflux pump
MTARHRWMLGFGAAPVVTAILAFLASSGNRTSVQTAEAFSSYPSANVVFASPGRTEGLSEAIQVGAAADGVLSSVRVREGQFVKKGALLGEIACDDLHASLQTALAEAEAARQARVRLLRGARDEEKKIAGQKTAAARATYEQVKSRTEMQRALYDKEEVSRASYEQAIRDLSVADADLQAAVRTEEFLAAPALPEDIARADADVSAAEGRARNVEERSHKCAILAPIDGTLLRVYAKPGESFSTVTPHPLFSIADASGRRVRAEIDERDIERVFVHQTVVILADALGGKKLTGTVASISTLMGRKSVYTGDPSDKSDRDVLEAVINLDGEARTLPVGLRVTVQFLSGKTSTGPIKTGP